MKLFDFGVSSYEELLSMYPVFYHTVYEMQEILKTEGNLSDNLKSDIQQVFFNRFIEYADSKTISIYEKIIGIEANKNKSLDERKRIVRAFLVGSGKLSATVIKSMIGAYTGGSAECSLDTVNYGDDFHTLTIEAQRGGGSNIDLRDIHDLIGKKIPAHLKYDLIFYENHDLCIETVIERIESDFPLCGTRFCGQENLF